MFDPTTEELIRGAPQLEGLDLDALPRQLTETYAQLVAVRVRLKGEPLVDVDSDVKNAVERLRHLASAYLAFVQLRPESPHRNAAAYVAATAYRLLAIEEELRRKSRSAILTRAHIPPAFSAALLFLLAGYSSEASEIAAAYIPFNTAPLSASENLAIALHRLSSGKLESLSRMNARAVPLAVDADERALDLVWRRLLEGVVELAREILGESQILDSDAAFAQVLRLTAVQSGGNDLGLGAFPGPHHLAALLGHTTTRLRETATALIPPPTGVGTSWRPFVRGVAERQPLLWPSHRLALSQGYLEPGISAVVSFPTGAGKSLVALLRVAAALGRGRHAVYLVPTNALVDQVRADLQEALPGFVVAGSIIETGEYTEVGEQIAGVTVMTPERCLALMQMGDSGFDQIDAIVFDECHLMHPRRDAEDRRSLDATMCLLMLTQSAPAASVLLMSAMMANAEELAQWLRSLTGAGAVPLEIKWKPTRQVRGCLVFQRERVRELQDFLADEEPKAVAKREARAKAAPRGKRKVSSGPPSVPQSVADALTAEPFAFFSLRSTWATKEAMDYSLVRIRDDEVVLGAGKYWKLAANRYAVAAELAVDFARAGVKTLVFAQDRRACESIAKRASSALSSRVAPPLNRYELRLREVAVAELGGAEYTFADDQRLAVSHHGLLLPAERRFNESRFKREDGVGVLCATSTLAQGMNLPALAVIIAGEERFDAKTGRYEILEAHDLLNAAGRAGRAGYFSQGVVLVVPGEVVAFDGKDRKIGARWIQLQEQLFSQSDQCLNIGDALERVLDLVQLRSSGIPAPVRYLIDRLPRESDGTVGARARQFLGRSFAAYRARGRREAYDRGVERLVQTANRERLEAQEWQLSLATASGVNLGLVISLSAELVTRGTPQSPTDAVTWFVEWLRAEPERTWIFFREENLARAFGSPPDEVAAVERAQWLTSILETLPALTLAWMSGSSLRELEPLLAPEEALGKLVHARAFALNVVVDLAYGIGILARVAHEEAASRGVSPPGGLSVAASCVREGYPDAIGLAIHYLRSPPVSRVEVHRELLGFAADPRIRSLPFPAVLREVANLLAEGDEDHGG